MPPAPSANFPKEAHEVLRTTTTGRGVGVVDRVVDAGGDISGEDTGVDGRIAGGHAVGNRLAGIGVVPSGRKNRDGVPHQHGGIRDRIAIHRLGHGIIVTLDVRAPRWLTTENPTPLSCGVSAPLISRTAAGVVELPFWTLM